MARLASARTSLATMAQGFGRRTRIRHYGRSRPRGDGLGAGIFSPRAGPLDRHSHRGTEPHRWGFDGGVIAFGGWERGLRATRVLRPAGGFGDGPGVGARGTSRRQKINAADP